MKYVLIVFVCALVLSSCGFYTDSYPYSASFIVDIPYEDSEAIMKKLKDTYPEYQRYIATDSGNVKKYEDNDRFITYYLPSIEYSVSCIVLSSKNPKRTQVMLVYAYDKKSETRKTINTFELTKEEDTMVKKEFEEQILPKLGKWDYYAPVLLRLLGVN